MGVAILGTGRFFPGEPVSNADLIEATGIESSPEWIQQRTGIEHRHIVDGDIERPNSHIASEAGRAILADAGFEDPRDAELDAIIVATCSWDKSDMNFPNTAHAVARQLGVGEKASFTPMDINNACAGYSNAMEITQGLLSIPNGKKRILTIGSEVLSSITNPEDRGTVILFGDGAAGALFERTDDDSGYLGGSSLRLDEEEILFCVQGDQRTNGNYIQMVGSEVFKAAVKHLPGQIETAIQNAGLEEGVLDARLYHQANERIIDGAERKQKSNGVYVPTVGVRTHGNVSAATTPDVLHEGMQTGRIKEGSTIAVIGFGAGMSIETVIWRV